jgi:Cu-processing system ATP-binding protein
VIEIRGLTVDLAKRRILHDVDLDVEEGEAVALAGGNGAGKTTILRCVLGLVRYRGTVRIGGIDVGRDPVRAKALVGYMPQVPAFCEETARGALRFVAALRRACDEDVDALLERVGLGAAGDRPVRAFSTGMKQRLSLAAALVGRPRVLVLDEPTASLDLRGQAEFTELLTQLHAEGRTVLLCSHRESEVRAVAQRIVLLDEGHVIANGPVGHIAATLWAASRRATGAEEPTPVCRQDLAPGSPCGPMAAPGPCTDRSRVAAAAPDLPSNRRMPPGRRDDERDGAAPGNGTLPSEAARRDRASPGGRRELVA